MTGVSETTHVGELVAERAGRARVFEQFGIDYCCGGKRPLGEVCQERGLDTGEVIAALHAADAGTATTEARDWVHATLSELIENIVGTHHAYLRRELPRLTELMAKTERAHGAEHGELAESGTVLGALRAELELHMLKEERLLFPAIRSLEAGSAERTGLGGSGQGPIRVMEQEHDSAGRALTTLRELTNDFTPPADACNTWRALLDGLCTLETDLHEHIHKENNVLFPRALRLEAARP